MNKILLSLVFALIVAQPTANAKNLFGSVAKQGIPVMSLRIPEQPPAALGIIWDRNSGNQIVYRDINSDVVCRCGDRIISIAGLEPNQAVATGANLGPPGSEVEVVILHNGEFWPQNPKRKPITCFSPTMKIFLHCRQGF